MKVTIRHRWEEIEPQRPHALDFVWWSFLFGVGVFVGQCVGTF